MQTLQIFSRHSEMSSQGLGVNFVIPINSIRMNIFPLTPRGLYQIPTQPRPKANSVVLACSEIAEICYTFKPFLCHGP